MSQAGPPEGYRESSLGGTTLVARETHHEALRMVLAHDTLHQWASKQPGARAMQGRDVAWATELSGGAKVVVRHSRHGGMLAALTGDLFLAPTRAPHELRTALALQAAGIPTPGVLAYAVYSAMGPFRRADVVTTLVDGADLPAAWAAAHTPAARDGIVDAMAALLRSLQAARARHPDLNVKNVLIAEADGAPVAWVLDIDRVNITSHVPQEMTGRSNAMRLFLSIMKWRRLHGLDFSAAHVDRLFAGAGVARPTFNGSTGA